jgi:hypothetical protein
MEDRFTKVHEQVKVLVDRLQHLDVVMRVKGLNSNFKF